MDKIAVLIPCYNEEHTVREVIRGFREVLPEAVIYVYDNHSTDRTAEYASAEGAVVRYEPRQGKGNVIRRMFREINAECYILVDGDMTYSPADAPGMVKIIQSHQTDMVVGDRMSSGYLTESRRRFHKVGNRLVTQTVNRLFHTDYRDVMTGYRGLSYVFVKSFPALSREFEVETEMSIHAAYNDLPIANIEIDYKERSGESRSKLHTVPDGLKVLLMIGKMFRLYRPFGFYTSIALVLAVVSTLFLIPVITEYRETGLVERFPTLIVCCFTYLAALLSMCAGVILQALRSKERREFEIVVKRLRETEDRERG